MDSSIHLLTLKEACQVYPGRPSPSTLKSRITKGRNGIKLQAKFDGYRYYTTKKWIEEYLEAQTCAVTTVDLTEKITTSCSVYDFNRRFSKTQEA